MLYDLDNESDPEVSRLFIRDTENWDWSKISGLKTTVLVNFLVIEDMNSNANRRFQSDEFFKNHRVIYKNINDVIVGNLSNLVKAFRIESIYYDTSCSECEAMSKREVFVNEDNPLQSIKDGFLEQVSCTEYGCSGFVYTHNHSMNDQMHYLEEMLEKLGHIYFRK